MFYLFLFEAAKNLTLGFFFIKDFLVFSKCFHLGVKLKIKFNIKYLKINSQLSPIWVLK
jgi:hypothetical protein